MSAPENTIPLDQTKSGKTSVVLHKPRIPYVPGVREPIRLPTQKIQLPAPELPPNNPPTLNWITSILPPVILIGGMLVLSQFIQMGNFIYLTIITGLGFPLANVIGLFYQKRAYKKALLKREENYKKKLEQERRKLEGLANQQRSTLDQEYVRLAQVIDIALAKGKRDRLWWRRPQDSDFLALRIGRSRTAPTFSIALPSFSSPQDPLADLPQQIVKDLETIDKVPFLLDLKKTGSVGITAPEPNAIYRAARRLILDIIVHHSPQDVDLAVVCNTGDAREKWGWLKWVPHTRTLIPNTKVRYLAFHPDSLRNFLDFLISEHKRRRAQKNRLDNDSIPNAILIVFDDNGNIRQLPDLASLIEKGHETGMYSIFLGEKNLPRIRARVDVLGQQNFRYIETWEGGNKSQGEPELAEMADCQSVARALSQLELLGETSAVSLPEQLRLSDMLGDNKFSLESIEKNWNLPRSDRELLQFPIGIHAAQQGLETTFLNLLPEEKGGINAYHSILIGTTGSGKSEFMKSLVLAAAYHYSPRLLNFFFMDFKGGAAFNIFKYLPHVTGVVTNLKPELVERGIDALENEIKRRQKKFEEMQVQNIWAYNLRQHSEPLMPHLLLLLDEFTKGLKEFDRLPAILDLVVRQGRSLGMYLILANQDVNPAVENLLNNVGWRIALKVAKEEEMRVVDKNLRIPQRAGRGYLRSINGDILEFQAGYSGMPLVSQDSKSAEDFEIFEVELDGGYKRLYKHTALQTANGQQDYLSQTMVEETQLLSVMGEATQNLGIQSAQPIYLPPLPEKIPLEEIFAETSLHRSFIGQEWGEVSAPTALLSVPAGFVDFPEICLQTPLVIDFSARDGHLWIVGQPGSGKTLTLTTILFSLAFTHTPAEAQFYILEYGNGLLQQFAALPHTGAVIRLQEQERLERLLNYLDQQLEQRRTSGLRDFSQTIPGQNNSGNDAKLFLVINNFAELRGTYPDFVERVSRYVRDGRVAGIHVIVVTNRGGELPKSISDNIARRIALQMNRDEYRDITGKMLFAPPLRVEGRGYWVDDRVGECQIALPLKDRDTIAQKMKEHWPGPFPYPIGNLPACVSLSEVLRQIENWPITLNLSIPIGMSYATLQPRTVNLADILPHWLVLGPRQSGKSNFLASIARSVLHRGAGGWEIKAFAFRPGLLARLPASNPEIAVLNNPGAILDECKLILEHLDSTTQLSKNLLILIDDLGFIFEHGRESIASTLDTLAQKLGTRNDVYLVASAIRDEIQGRLASNIVRLLRQSRAGVVFSLDTMELDWLGVPAQFVMAYRRQSFPVGRGFFVNRGIAEFVQTLYSGECTDRTY